MIQDLLFCKICDEIDDSELSGIKENLVANRALHSLAEFRLEVQLILTYFWREKDDIHQELVLDQTVVADRLIPVLRSLKDPEQLTVMLKKMKCLAKIAVNRQLFRKLGLLQCLGTLFEQYSGSSVESVVAELIHYLLSDAPDEETMEEADMNPIALFEDFMTVLYEG